MTRDPFNGDNRENAHLFVLAEPLSGRPDLLVDVTDTVETRPSWNLVQAGLTPDLDALLGEVNAAQFSCGLQDMQTHDLRPDGVAWASYGLVAGRTPRNDGVNELAGELEIRDNGGLRLYHSQLSRLGRDGSTRVLFEAVAVGSVRRFLAVVKASADVAGYYGNWSLAAGATRLEGCYSLATSGGWGAEGPPLGEDIYGAPSQLLTPTS